MGLVECDDCVLCKIVGGAIDTPRLAEFPGSIVIEARDKLAPTHWLMVARRHDEMPFEEMAVVVGLAAGMMRRGFRMMINHVGILDPFPLPRTSDSGASFVHFHVHLFGGCKLVDHPVSTITAEEHRARLAATYGGNGGYVCSCGKPGKPCNDPFMQDVHGQNIPTVLCENCYAARCEEI